ARHADIHEDDVRTALGGELQRVEAIDSLEDVDVLNSLLEKWANAGSHQRMIVHEQDSKNRAATPTGRRHVIVVPRPSVELMLKVPPMQSRRSRMPTRPRCPSRTARRGVGRTSHRRASWPL